MLCPYCLKEFPDANLYRHHMKQDHHDVPDSTPLHVDYGKVDITELKCRLCHDRFEYLSTIAEHLQQAHKINIEPSSLQLQPYRLQDMSYACGVCDKEFIGITQVSKHLPSHFLKCFCTICGKGFVSVETLKRHMAQSHSEKKYACLKCHKSFDTREERQAHVDNTRCWPYCCTMCPERFKTYTMRTEHLVKMHNKPQKTFSCACGNMFKSSKAYRVHCISVHDFVDLSCSYCGKKCINKFELDKHVVKHTKEKKFHCTVCNKLFARKFNLSEHMWIHNEVKRFVCKVCDKTFNQKLGLTKHIRCHHSETKVQNIRRKKSE